MIGLDNIRYSHDWTVAEPYLKLDPIEHCDTTLHSPIKPGDRGIKSAFAGHFACECTFVVVVIVAIVPG